MILLIDGYNVIAPVAAPGRPPAGASSKKHWLRRERERLIKRLAENLPAPIVSQTWVVFDAKDAPRDVADQFVQSGVHVRFARGYAEADDLLEELIVQHTAPQTLTVISSDHRVQNAAKRRSATAYDSEPWLDQLLEGRTQLGWYPKSLQDTPGADPSSTGEKPQELSAGELDHWMEVFNQPRRSED